MTCSHDAWFRSDRIWLAVLVGFMMVIGTRQAYLAGVKHGKDAGYSEGWRDAHCGMGNSCESGDE